MHPQIPQERSLLLIQIKEHLAALKQRRVLSKVDIGPWEISEGGTKRGPERAPQSGWKKFSMGQHWGEDKPDYNVWFRSRFAVPKEFLRGETFVEIGVSACREGLVFLNGQPFHGLSKNHKAVRLQDDRHLRKPVDIVIQAYTKGIQNPAPRYYGKFEYAELRHIDLTVDRFYWDLQVVYATLCDLDPNSASFQKILDLLRAVFCLLQPASPDRDQFLGQVRGAEKLFHREIAKYPSEPHQGRLLLAGHSHIDTAWLWPLLETKRKCGRTFSTILHLMKVYPEFCYSQGQPQLYQYTKTYYPEVYRRIKERVAEGRWDPAGPAWVEMDSNLAGGEAIIRQFLYGNRFLEKEFGLRNDICWLPDAFGYNWNLPQILLGCGIRAFVTTKIDWSMVTAFPYTTFQWEGPDGSRILGMMPPLNYNGNLIPSECRKQWNLVKQKNVLEEIPFSFGWGDGGGGPTPEMIENGKRLANLTGVPQCRFGTLTGYFDELLGSLDFEQLPVWNGELYLELHRACQITQARTKRNNRKMEILLRETEWFASLSPKGFKRYPGKQLLAVWEEVLTNQFHDILPGSGAEAVYEEADESYGRCKQITEELLRSAREELCDSIDTRGEGRPLAVFNTLSWDRGGPTELPMKPPTAAVEVIDSEGRPVPHQVSLDSKGGKRWWIDSPPIPSMGYSLLRLLGSKGRHRSNPLEGEMKVSPTGIENRFFKVRLDKKGRISRLYDKINRREAIPPGELANRLLMFHDHPHMHDAWDYDFNVDENRWEWDDLQSIEVVEEGPVRAALEIRRRTAGSWLVQRLVVYRSLPRIDFETEIDWWEKRTLLKASFPVAVRSPRATYEIQFATIERATHNNTPFDRARFEVPHHRWVDLSEGNYGVSVANDCKYGSDVEGNVIRLSLLRGPTHPDPRADEGRHSMVYSLIPHRGDWREGRIVRAAAGLNVPLSATEVPAHSGTLPERHSFIGLDSPNVVVETLKKAEEGEGWILRLYEAEGSRGPVVVTLGFPVGGVEEVDLVERNPHPARFASGRLSFEIHPYQIRTFRLLAD